MNLFGSSGNYSLSPTFVVLLLLKQSQVLSVLRLEKWMKKLVTQERSEVHLQPKNEGQKQKVVRKNSHTHLMTFFVCPLR
jgi:hypothetical protein